MGFKSVFSKNKKASLKKSGTVYGNLQRAQEDGLYKTNYVEDHPVHHTDPPYSTIKPGYRAHVPVGMCNQLDMKARYSFDPFGKPKVARAAVKATATVFRETLQTDTPYYRDRVGEAQSLKHALVDPSHTFLDPRVPKLRPRYNVTTLKGDKEKDSKKLQHERRVTYDFRGTPVLRLAEERDRSGGIEETVAPLENYRRTKEANKVFFDEMARAGSLEERMRVSHKYHSRGGAWAAKVPPKDDLISIDSTRSRPTSVFA